MNTTTAQPTATEPQRSFLHALLDQRDLTASTRWMDATQGMDEGELKTAHAALRQRVDSPTLTKSEASQWISRLKELPYSSRPTRAADTGEVAFKELAEQVPAGRYAVTGEDGSTDFYRVDKPDDGKWAGYTFVKLGLGGGYGHDLKWERVSFRNTAAILRKVAEDGPQEAAQRFGKEIGHCGICGRNLTNEESRAFGIGPDCRAKMGW